MRLFAESFTRSLDNQIAAETQRTDRSMAQRRLDYGEPITGDDNDDDAGDEPESDNDGDE